MFIEGSVATNKTEFLVEKYSKLLNDGVPAGEILVLVQNSTLRNNFKDEVLKRLEIDCFEQLNIHSFFSLVYNTISDNWAFLEDRNIYDNPVILPNLAGLEISQFILKDILKEVKFKGYNSKMSLIQQIFRRYSLIVQNNLSVEEVKQRAKILKEGFSDEASLVINKLLKKTLELRDFDYLRQCLLFNFVYKNTDYFKDVKYLFIDDADECTPICIDFIEFISKQIKDFYIAIDPLGSSRCGYLSADKNNYKKLKNIFNSAAKTLNPNSNISEDANSMYKNITSNSAVILENFEYGSYSKRPEIVEAAIKKINGLLEKGVKPCEISIITPILDDMLKFSLKEQLNRNAVPLYLSGSEKLIQNKLVSASVTILKLSSELRSMVTEFDIRNILSNFLRIPIKYCEEILIYFNKKKELPEYDFGDEEYNKSYADLLFLIKNISGSDKKISEQIIEIYDALFSFNKFGKEEINKFNFFVKQIRDFENIFGSEFEKRKTDIILQTENSVIAENPYSVLEIEKNDLVVSTPQKIIDNHVKTEYQIWLDISNSEWIKSDTGPLYNAWVFQKDWDKDKYSVQDNIELSKEKTARVLRKLTLCAKKRIYCLSSLFDSNGVENYGAIESYIFTRDLTDEKGAAEGKYFKITPRKDQEPVLAYKNGKMGISAVPGAGKTTILLALIIKLMEDGVNPENIFVLTYMDSAARNFRERIKNANTKTSKLPNISTIHGLALKILKENGNFERLGYSDDFDICDDSQRGRILRELSVQYSLKSKKSEEYDRAVSVFKMGAGVFPDNLTDKDMITFKNFYNSYQEKLKEFNLIDYDDMLISSVRILKENPDILEQYQQMCKYIIEDEAQDSSAIQQELISLLSGKYNNVIRCGDVNQAITTTFSNADVEGFRRFITENTNVKMNCSQRCAQEIWTLANGLVSNSLKQPDSKNSFFEMYMSPVKDKNPVEKHSVYTKIFETEQDEKNYILKTVKETLSKNPDYTVGVLLRYNYQVNAWQSLFEDNGFRVITRNQCLGQKSIFRVVHSILKAILTPFDNTILAGCYETLAEMGLYKRGYGREIEKYENPFVKVNCDNLISLDLEQFYWDMNYWMSLSSMLPHELVLKIAGELKIFKSEIDKANIYLISTLIKRICINDNSLNYAVTRLTDLSKKSNLSGFNFFSENDEDDKKTLQGKVQIMTMHKSKGDEFDIVFLPGMTKKQFPLTINSIELKSADFTENIRAMNPKYKKKSEYELKKEILDESLRLLYVAITRAKHKLYITSPMQYKMFGKTQDTSPNIDTAELMSGGSLCTK